MNRFQSNSLSTLDPTITWAVNVAPGTINDGLPSILYQRAGDARGWRAPDGYVEQTIIGAGNKPDPNFVERDLLDDPTSPPFVTVQDAVPGQKGDFTQIPDSDRMKIEGGAFCSASDWEMELWRSHVLLSATPFTVATLNPLLPAPRLLTYRIYAVNGLPALGFGGDAGGWIELATLYLLRDPDTLTTQIRVRQRVWWCLQGRIFQPGQGLASLIGTIDSNFGEFASIELAGDQSIIEDAAYVDFWTA